MPSVADWFYLAGYPLLAAGLVLLLVRAGGHHRRAAIGGGAIVTLAFALFQWVWIVDGIVDGGGSPTAARRRRRRIPRWTSSCSPASRASSSRRRGAHPRSSSSSPAVVPLLVSDEIYGADVELVHDGRLRRRRAGSSRTCSGRRPRCIPRCASSRSRGRRRRGASSEPLRIAASDRRRSSARPIVLLVQDIRNAPFDSVGDRRPDDRHAARILVVAPPRRGSLRAPRTRCCA